MRKVLLIVAVGGMCACSTQQKKTINSVLQDASAFASGECGQRIAAAAMTCAASAVGSRPVK